MQKMKWAVMVLAVGIVGCSGGMTMDGGTDGSTDALHDVVNTDSMIPDGNQPDVNQPDVMTAACGDGTIDAGETCDDGNTTAGDGCSAACASEPGFTCSGEPSTCRAICGDRHDRYGRDLR